MNSSGLKDEIVCWFLWSGWYSVIDHPLSVDREMVMDSEMVNGLLGLFGVHTVSALDFALNFRFLPPAVTTSAPSLSTYLRNASAFIHSFTFKPTTRVVRELSILWYLQRGAVSNCDRLE
jgi:hypothetical protein